MSSDLKLNCFQLSTISSRSPHISDLIEPCDNEIFAELMTNRRDAYQAYVVGASDWNITINLLLLRLQHECSFTLNFNSQLTALVNIFRWYDVGSCNFIHRQILFSISSLCRPFQLMPWVMCETHSIIEKSSTSHKVWNKSEIFVT